MLAEVFHIFIEFCVKLKAANTLNTMKALQVLKALNALKVWKKLKARNHPPIDSTPNPSCSGWQSERRHVDQPRQRNCPQVLQGGYPPEGPMAEVLRAEAETAGSNQRICRLRISTAAPQPRVRAAARRSLPTFHRWKVGRRRRDQQTKRRENRGRGKSPQQRQAQPTTPTRVTRKRQKPKENTTPP